MTAIRLRTLWWRLPALVLVSVTALSGGYAWLQTAGGKRWLADRIEAVVSTPERQLAIGTLDGVIPFAPTATGISLSDADGAWLTVDRASIRLDPLALLNGVALFETVDVGRVMMLRRPPASASKGEDNPTAIPTWPELPVDLEVERLSVADVALAASILGEPASFSIDGAVRLGDLGDGLSLDLVVVRTDDSPGSLTARMHYVPGTAQLTTKLRLNEPEGGMLARLADLPELPALSVDLSGDGTLDEWGAQLTVDGGDDLRLDASVEIVAEETGRRVRVALSLEGDGLVYRDIALQSIVATVDAIVAGPLTDARSPIDIATDLSIDGLDPGAGVPSGLLAPSTRIATSGSITPGGAIVIDSLTVVTPAAQLSAEGTAEAWAVDAAHLAGILNVPDLSRFDEVADQALAGGATVDLSVDWDGTTAVVRASTELERLSTGIAAADALLGTAPRITAAVSLGADGAVGVEGLELTGAGVSMSASGAIGDDALGLEWRVSLADLAAVDPSLGGSLAATGRLSGTLEDPAATVRITLTDAVLAGYPVSGARLDANIADLATQPAGTIKLEGTVAGLSAQATAELQVEDDGAIRIDALALQLASLAAEGAVTLDGAGTASGQVTLSIASLADLAPLIGEPLSGRVDASVSLSQAGGRQFVDATVSATGAGLPDLATMGRAELTVHLSDALATPMISARLLADEIFAGGVALDRAVMTAEGRLDGLTIAVDLSGEMLAASIRGNVALADGKTLIEVATLTARYADTEASLLGPARVTLAGDGVLLEGLVLQAEGGRLTADGRYGDPSDLAVMLSDIPLELARLAAPDPGLSGKLDGRIRLAGTRGAPLAFADFTATGVTLPAIREVGIAGMDIAAALDWDGSALRLESTVNGGFGGVLTASATFSAPLDPRTGLPAFDHASHLTGRVSGDARLGVLNDLLAARGDRVGGAVSADLTVTGSMADPRVAGTLELTGGSYRSVLTGISLDDIGLRLNGDGDRLTIARLSAKAPNGGTVTASGGIGIDPNAGFPADISVRFDDVLIINNDIVSAEVAGKLAITGELMRSLDVAGRLTVVEAEIRLPDRLPPSIQTLDVEEINVPPELEARRPTPPTPRTAEGAESPLRIILDLAIDAPKRIFVRGRGLDAEVAGEVTVRGNADAPAIGGGFQLRRGFFNALGRRFNFDEGVVTLPEDGSLDADIRFVARTQLNDAVAQIIVSGRASAPRITVESAPDLPQDEILARILFGRRASSLTAFESVRLARSAAELTGIPVGPDVLGGVRGALGLDMIDINRQGNGVESSILNVGGRIRDKVTLGVQQGLRAGSGRVTVQIELTPNISVETDVGVNSTGRLGIGMEWEY